MKRSIALALGLAAGLSTAASADTGTADNTNAIIGGDTNRPAERVMQNGTYDSALTGAGRGDNTNAITANPDDFMRNPGRVYHAPVEPGTTYHYTPAPAAGTPYYVPPSTVYMAPSDDDA